MKSANRTTGVFIGGVAGGLVGGPLGAISGGISGGTLVDGIYTVADSVDQGQYRPSGIFQ